MTLGDTIIAIATAPGRSARGIIRLSGPATHAILRRAAIVEHRTIHRPLSSEQGDGEVDDNGGADRTPRAGRITIRAGAHALPALAIRSFGPRSFTGEDAAELLLPGNPDLLARLVGEWIEAFRADGLRGAQPGEFSARAFLNGRLTPEQAEGVGAVIAARSEAELAAARRVLDGRAGAEHRALADETASLLALVEAGIDFTDQEDVVAIAPEQAYARALAAAGRIDALVGPGAVREAEDALPVVALAGAPNAGKSTLFNALLGRRRAIVSDVPGTTRDALAERLELAPFTGGGPFRAPAVTLVDLAGLDAVLARRGAIDAAAQEAARRAIAGASVIVWCDPAGRFDPRDLPLGLAGRAVIRVRTKGDLPGGGSGRDAGALAVCALDGWGLAALGRAIADAAGREPAGGAEALVLPRHRAALAAARDHLRRAAELVAPDLGSGRLSRAELVADALRAALDELGAIAGRISPDDVIGRIFATFCIGK